jgi:hypothetical protein
MDQLREGSLGFHRRREGGSPVCSRALREAGVGPAGTGLAGGVVVTGTGGVTGVGGATSDMFACE